MALTESQVWAASKIDAKAGRLFRAGKDDTAVMVAMIDQMPRFKELVEALPPADLDELARRFSSFRRYAKVLETLAGGIQSGGIQSGVIKVPQ